MAENSCKNSVHDWFLITSAVGSTKDGLDQDQRLAQTLDTLHSIHRHCPRARTVLLETTVGGLDSKVKHHLQSQVTSYREYGHDPMLRMTHAWARDEISLVKSPNEALVLHRALTEITDIQPQDRVFKLSGRYQLAHDFDRDQHQRPGHLVVLRREPSIVYYSTHNQERFAPLTPWQYKTRLYSFCGSLKHIMAERYFAMLTYLVELYQQHRFNDIEHAMFAAVQDLPVIELPVIGVQGMQAPNQQWITE